MWITVGLLLAGYQRYQVGPQGVRFDFEDSIHHAYATAATVLLTVLLRIEVARQWLSIAWGIEGLALVAAGFALRDRVFRIAGLAVFGVLVTKVLFVDLAGAETVYRILAFVATGCILLAASYAYTRFSAKRAPVRSDAGA